MPEHPRRRIMDAALTLFDAKGYDGTAMEDIRKAAGFRTKSSLYAHFAGKEELARALLQEIVEAEHRAIRDAVKAPRPAWERIWLLVEAVVAWGLQHRAAYRFCFVRLNQDRFVQDPVLEARIAEEFDMAARLIDEARSEGAGIRDWPTADLLRYCQAIINAAILSSGPKSAIGLVVDQVRVLCAAILLA